MTAPLRGAALRANGSRLQRDFDRAGWAACLRLRGALTLRGVRLPIGSATAEAAVDAALAEIDTLRAEVARLNQETRS